MRYFGDDVSLAPDLAPAGDWQANWDQPGNTTSVYESNPATGQGSQVPYYLAADVPPAGLPAHPDYAPSSGLVDINGQPVAQPGAPAAPASSSSFDWSGLFTGVVRGLTGQQPGAPKQVVPQAAAPSMLPWVIGGVAAVGLVAVLVMSSKRKSVAGYRRRRSRR